MANSKPKRRKKIYVFSAIIVVLASLSVVAFYRKREVVISIQTEKVSRRNLTELVVFLNDVISEITQFSYLGREGLNLQGNDPRYTTEMIRGPQDPNGHSAGSFAPKYWALRTVNTYLAGVEGAADLSAAEKAASKGFAQTLKAILLHRVIVRE